MSVHKAVQHGRPATHAGYSLDGGSKDSCGAQGKKAKKGEAKAPEVEDASMELPESSPGTRSRSLRTSGEQVRYTPSAVVPWDGLNVCRQYSSDWTADPALCSSCIAQDPL